MKKSLVALAVLGAFSGAASAQSNVTLYGIVDIGVQWVDAFASATGQEEDLFSVESGYQSGSRFGLRGSEALGGNMNAIFTIEGGFAADTGTSAQGGRLFGRQAFAGLQAGWGTVVLGRIATPSSGTGSFDMFGQIDPFGTAWGVNTLGSTFVAANNLREDNSILYVTPTFAGFKVAAQYSFNTDLGELAPQENNTSAFNISGSWGSGPFYVAVTYDNISYADCLVSGTNPCANAGVRPGAGLSDDTQLLQVGGTWDFKVAKLHAAYANQKEIGLGIPGLGVANPIPASQIPANVTNYTADAYMIGVTIPLFGGSLLGSYQYSDADSITVAAATPTGAATFDPDYDVFGIGYSYPFSRRTNGYIGYGQRNADGSLSSTVVDRSQFGIGVRHQF